MPDLDSGHIFLTTFAPIKDSAEHGLRQNSFAQNVRIALARLPTAQQSPATKDPDEKTEKAPAINSPFARNRRTHLARMFVIDDAIYNGRIGKNALLAALTKDDPAVPQKVDKLKRPYLVFCADIDAVEEDGTPLPKDLTPAAQRRVRDAYARKLWETMGPELRDIYGNCEGFDDVKTGDDFAVYLNRCHVETTMPFHDYYLKMPKFHMLPLKPLLAAVALPLIFTLLALVLRILGVMEMPGLGWDTLFAFVVGAVVTGAAGYAAVRFAMSNGNKPLPPAQYDDLPSVLKALYIQQRFSDFVIDAQGQDAKTLHAAFGEFLAAHDPSNRDGPTQAPGVIGTPAPQSS